ncbi:benzoyl-CoA reductase/2-hydroxyglutaryl-CoA dehydratase subunit BcrC/BadD/HgdB [Sphingomonas zeicaulis]|uniref:2-hydroxyacyl-CoA dehydratase n=1 Tax=Sphingomonas zeicaulis TaxID=1632740 RepID=UPI003D19179E
MDARTALDRIAKAYADPDAVAARLQAEGAPVVRTIGSDAPVAWLRAAGMHPVRLVPAPGAAPRGRRLMKRLLDPALTETPLLITRADTEQAQLFAALRERRRLGQPAPRHLHLLDLVHQGRPASARYNAVRLAQTNAWLVSIGGRTVTDALLERVAEEEAAVIALLRQAGALCRADPPRLRGSQMLQMIGCAAILPPGELTPLLDAVIAGADALPALHGRRAFVAGSPQENDALYRQLEAEGFVLVGDDQDWGDRRLGETPLTGMAPFSARKPSEEAAATAAAAAASRAKLVLHLSIEGDEAAPWQVSALARAVDQGIVVEPRRIRLSAPRPPRQKPAAAKTAAPPSHSRKSLESLADFGAYQRNWFQEVRQQVAAGTPFAMVNANAPQEILRALDIPFVVNQWWASIVAAKQQTRRYRELLRDHDYPTDVEAYSAQGLAAAFDHDADQSPWGGLPRPDFVHAVVSSDATTGIFDAWAQETGARLFLYERTVDPRPTIVTRWWEELPDRWEEVLEPERIDLLVAELADVIATIEATTGRRFSQERFLEVMERVNEQEDYYRRTRDLIARTVPAPISIVDSMPATMVPQWHRGTVWARDAAKAFYSEVADRVAAGHGVVAQERVRLMWVGRGLWSDMAFYQRWEESHGAVFVWSMYLALAADGYIRRFDRGRDPMRALAARFLTMGDELRMPSWAGPWHVHEAETNQVDGAVALSDADPFALEALKAAAIPVLELGVDNFALDPEATEALEARITAFIEGPATDRAGARRA